MYLYIYMVCVIYIYIYIYAHTHTHDTCVPGWQKPTFRLMNWGFSAWFRGSFCTSWIYTSIWVNYNDLYLDEWIIIIYPDLHISIYLHMEVSFKIGVPNSSKSCMTMTCYWNHGGLGTRTTPYLINSTLIQWPFQEPKLEVITYHI